jgi:hypothetical protein
LNKGMATFGGSKLDLSWTLGELPLSEAAQVRLIRAALHLEAGPIRCVRGLKSSLVIRRKAQIGPNPLHLEVGLIW